MKIPEELFNKYKTKIRYNELTADDWATNTWELVGKGYDNIKNCYMLKNEYGTWIEIPFEDFVNHSFIEQLPKDELTILAEKAWKENTLHISSLACNFINGFKAGYRKAKEE